MPHVDLFTTIHKSLRAMIFVRGRRLQPVDWSAADGAATLGCLVTTLGMLTEHHGHEETYVFPAVRAFEPGMIDEFEAEHREIERLLAHVDAALAATRAASDASAAKEAGGELSRRFNELAAYYLGHLAREEVTLLPATQAHFGDEELLAMRAQIMASMTPERYAEWLAWMLPALNLDELGGMLAGAKATAPPPALQELTSIAERTLEARRWTAVRRRAGL